MAVYGDHVASGGNLAPTSTDFVRDVVDKLYWLEPDQNPLLLLMRKVAKAKAMSFKHEWDEQEDLAMYTQINNSGGYNTTDVSFILDDSSIIPLTSILVNQRTNETYRVTANNTGTNTVTVSRSWGGTAAASINDNDYVHVLGTTPGEGAESNVGIVTSDVNKHNFVEEFRDSFGLTWIAEKSKTYHGNLMDRYRASAGRTHKQKIEMSMWYGERNRDTGSDAAFASMGGLKEFITTNVSNFGGTPTFDSIVTASETAFEYGSSTKLLFCGRAGFSNVAKVGTDTIRSGKVVDGLGLNVSYLEVQHGRLNIFKHKAWRGNEYTKRGFVIDPECIRWVPMNGLDTRLRKGLEANSATAKKEEWYTAGTMQRVHEKKHAIWNDLS